MKKNNNRQVPERWINNISEELTNGFKLFSDVGKAVAIFGSGRFLEDNPHYQDARKLAALLVKEDFAVVTGGGPGIMEAANRGAVEGNGKSIGLNIIIPRGQTYNIYVKSGIRFNYFFTRKVIFEKTCSGYIFFPGGFGTLDEFFEIVNLIQNRKIDNTPVVVAIGKDYWQELFNWLKKVVYKNHQAISLENFEIFHLTDSLDEAVSIIKKYAP